MILPDHIRNKIADRIIRGVGPAIIITMLLASLGMIFLGARQYHRLIPATITLIGIIPAYYFTLKGKPLTGAMIILSMACMALLSGMTFSGGIRAPAYIAALSFITIYVILYGAVTGTVFAILTIATGGLFIWLDYKNLIPKVDDPPPLYFLLLFGIFLFMQIWFVLIPVKLMLRAQADKLSALSKAAESEKLALVGRIAGKMAHDFNNILGAVMGNAELALMDCKDEKTRKTLELIFNQTIRGKNLTRNLVAFAKDQEPRQEFFKVSEKMELIISLLRKDLEGIFVTREYGKNIPELLADPGMIEHAVVNLVQNSIHATSLTGQPQIIFRTWHHEEQIFIEIEDNGCGIPDDCLEKIFEPSFTLKGSRDSSGAYKPGISGTGYGMANVKKYVEQHNGKVSIQSRIGKGTVVTLALPVTNKKTALPEKSGAKPTTCFFNAAVLIVEDESSISDIQYKILTDEPYQNRVDIAKNGQAAIDLYSKNSYDIISLDYALAGELTGMDVYRHIRGKDKTIPILFISGNIEFIASIKNLKEKDPYIDHLSKPCRNSDYISSIQRLMVLSGRFSVE